MARAMTAEYASKTAAFGNVAYDLGRTTTYPGWERPWEQEEERPKRRVKEREKVKARPVKKRADRAQGVSLFALIGFPLVAVMVVIMIMSYVQLTDVQSATAELEAQYVQLNADKKELLIAYESAFNLHEIEEYAVNELGMVKLSNEQIVSTSVERTDRAVILQEDAVQDTGFVAGVKAYFNSVLEYLK